MQNLHFKIQSPENFTRLLTTILFEKSEFVEEYGALWYEVFNSDDVKGDALFLQFLKELFPQGVTVAEEELQRIFERAMRYLRTDDYCRDFQVERMKQKYSSWVYSKWDKRLIPCGFAKHGETVWKCVIDYFGEKDVESYDAETLCRFVLSNFEIRSSNSTVESIANDMRHFSLFLHYEVLKRRDELETYDEILE